MKEKDEDIAHPGMVSKVQKTPNFGPIQYFAMDTLEGCINGLLRSGQSQGGYASTTAKRDHPPAFAAFPSPITFCNVALCRVVDLPQLAT